MASMDTKEFLRPNDKDIAKEIAEWLGQGSQFSESINIRQGHELFSETLSEQAIPVMSATDIMEMNDTYVIVKHREFKPMKLHRLKWFECSMLKKRVGLTPPVLKALPHIPTLPPLGGDGSASTSPNFVDPNGRIRKPGTLKQTTEDKNLVTGREETTLFDRSPKLPRTKREK